MPIKDVLWACPICHQIESIAADGRCQACRAGFARGRGASITATTAEGREEQSPLEWLAQLPWPDLDGEGRALPGGLEPPFRQLALVRLAVGELPLRRAGVYLGLVEKLGPQHEGELELSSSHIGFSPRRGTGWSWELAQVTAIQPSSSSIQLKARQQPVASMRFPAGSLRLWEQRLQYCVRRAYEGAGKGQVVEFQPHIRTR